MAFHTIDWNDHHLRILDQTLLPNEVRNIELDTVEKVWEAIKSLRIRGAPAIGVCAAFGILVAIRQKSPRDFQSLRRIVEEAADYLASSRPTAVNLFWALDRMRAVADALNPDAAPETAYAALEREALAILEQDRQLCRRIGGHGASLIRPGSGVLTHCNAGGLATSDYGTALAVMFRAHENGVGFRVYADETRPLLQGARLTAWELVNAGIDVTLICDNMAAQVMREKKIDLIIVGADRVAANGDTANKIGTYAVALLARAHGLPFYVAAPSSTFDLSLAAGSDIPIEERDPAEITAGFGHPTAPKDVKVYNPAFDVTPAEFIAGFITEHGIIGPPFSENIAATLRNRHPVS